MNDTPQGRAGTTQAKPAAKPAAKRSRKAPVKAPETPAAQDGGLDRAAAAKVLAGAGVRVRPAGKDGKAPAPVRPQAGDVLGLRVVDGRLYAALIDGTKYEVAL